MDYDGTLTKFNGRLAYKDELCGEILNTYQELLIPGSEIAEPILTKERDNFANVFASTWYHVLNDPTGRRVLRESGRHAPIREGANQLFGYLKSQDVSPTIVSANFEPFVKGGLEQIKYSEGTKMFAIRSNSLLSAEKGNILLHITQRNPNTAYVYVGDGKSDIPAAEARGIISCYYALEGSDFAEYLKQEGITHFTYRNLNDVALKLYETQQRANALRQQNGFHQN